MIQRAADFIYKYFLFFLPQPSNGVVPGHPYDYIAHFLVSLAGVCVLYIMLLWPLKMLGISPRLTIFTAAALMLALGIAKEISDIRLGKTDIIADLIADILGLIAGMLIIFLIIKFLK